MTSTFRLIPVMLLLASCMQVLPPDLMPDPEPDSNACGAAELQGLVGQRASVLDTMRFSQPTRIIRPGEAVTMEYGPNRLNIEINEADRIARVSCG